MGIRVTLLVAFLPVFLALALLSAVVEHFLVKAELTWGLAEESRAVAIGVASFADGYQSEAELTKRFEMITKLFKETGLKKLEVVEFKKNRKILSIGEQGQIPEISQDLLSTIKNGHAIQIDPQDTAYGFVSTAAAPIFDKGGQTVAWVTALLDATSLKTELAALYDSLVMRVIVISALALPVGWLFGTFMVRRIKSSRRRAELILSTPEPRTLRRSGVRELDDVNEMIEILAALLEERKRFSQGIAVKEPALPPTFESNVKSHQPEVEL